MSYESDKNKEAIIHWTGGLIATLIVAVVIIALCMNHRGDVADNGKITRAHEKTEQVRAKECSKKIKDELILSLCINGMQPPEQDK